MTDAPFHALPSPLSPEHVLEKLRALGPSSTQPTEHRQATLLELIIEDETFCSVLEVMVERRPHGSYVTVRLIPSNFVREFMRAVYVAVAVVSVISASYVASFSQGRILAERLGLVAVASSLVVALASLLIDIAVGTGVKPEHHVRLRHELSRAVLAQ